MTMALAIRASRRYRCAIAIILLVSFLPGCASFREVSAFASLSSSAAHNNAVLKDYIGAIERRKQYEPQKFHGELEAQKARREAQRASLDALQRPVMGYMQALGGFA